MICSFYNLTTGLFTGRTYQGNDDDLAQNIPSGCAVIEGDHDHLSCKVNIATGCVEPYQPEAPADDDFTSWQWDTSAKRWKSVPTLAAIKLPRVAQVQAAIDEQERRQNRPLRELMLSMTRGQQPPSGAVSSMAAIDAEIVRLRALRSEIAAAQNTTQLDAVPRP